VENTGKKPKSTKKREIDEYVGQRLAIARKAAGLDQGEMADKLGIVKHQVYMIETGRQGVSLLRLYDACDALGIRPADLLDETVGFAPPQEAL
jgi:transcriptional regulator with XRE-family HTH domain